MQSWDARSWPEAPSLTGTWPATWTTLSPPHCARDIVNKLMLFARQRPPRKALLNLNDVVEQSLSILKTRCEKGGIELGQTLSDELPLIFADSSQLQQVVVNLVVNAVQAMPGGGRLSIVTHGDADSATLVVQDTGVGMSQEVLAQCFEPFYTTKDVGREPGWAWRSSTAS